MNPSRLLQHFAQISEGPDAVPRLRRFILDLAVRGKLVEQDATDEPASTFLRGRELFVEPHVEPWRLPVGWAWSCYANVGDAIGGGTPTKTTSEFWDGSIPWVSPKDMKVEFIADAKDHISELALEHSAARLIPEGSLLMVVRGMILSHSFPVAISKVPVAINQDMKAIVPFRTDISGALLLISKGMKPNVLQLVSHSTHGTCKLLTDDLFSLPLPIPPLAEQHRIVARADELMALCDQLEAAQSERERRRDRLVAASLDRLNRPADAQSFRESARFHLDHLSRLARRPDQLAALRQTILDLAIQGKLVAQDARDGLVGDELALSDRAREATAREDRRADNGRQTLLAADERWDIPSTWEWRALADLALFIDYRGQTPAKTEGGVRLITAKNVKRGFINQQPEEFLAETTYPKWMTRGIPIVGDVLFTTEAPMGNAAVVRLTDRFALAQRVICFRLYGAVDPDFLVLQLVAEAFRAILERTATGLTAKGIKAAKLKRLPIAVPPFAEQLRIVAKAKELMAVCDQLEMQLTAAQAEGGRLLDAVIHEALEVTA
ncbi:MAG: restriction endonuclease subunit S [Acidobacteriota bacterium]